MNGGSVTRQSTAKTEGNGKGSNPYLALASLITLTVQNATQTLTMRYVRTRAGDMFFSTSAVCMSELVKCLACLFIIFGQEKFNVGKWMEHLKVNIFHEPMDCLKVSVPGFLYVIQNNLLYVAATNLEAAKFQVAYQLKLLTTALFSVIMLRTQLSRVQWLSLVVLMGGVALVQLPSASVQNPSSSSGVSSREQSPLLGFSAVVMACFLSGFSGVYFEKLLKSTPQSVYVRNVQLGALGVILGMAVCYVKEGRDISEKGFFFGYDVMVWFTVFLLALGGLVVAAVVKYADNILKGFATSGSIILACFASMVLFNFQPTIIFYGGTVLVITSLYLYSKFNTVDNKLLPLSTSTVPNSPTENSPKDRYNGKLTQL